MKQQLAKATKEKLERDDRVVEASIERNDKGIYVEAKVENEIMRGELKGDLSQYPVWIDVVLA